MARGLYETEPVMRRSIDACSELFHAIFDADLREIIFPAVEGREEASGVPGAGLLHSVRPLHDFLRTGDALEKLGSGARFRSRL